MNKHILLWGAIALLSAIFTSCNDETEDDYEPVAWEFDQYGDKNIRPGDDFYRYVCGNGVSEAGSDSWAPLAKLTKQANDFTALIYDDSENNPIHALKRINELRSVLSSPDNVDKFISNLKLRLGHIKSAKSMQDVPSCIAEITKAGYTFIIMQPKIISGRKFSISPFVSFFMNTPNYLDINETDTELLTKAGLYEEYQNKISSAYEMFNYFMQEIQKSTSSKIQQTSKATALDKFFEAIGNKNPNFTFLDEGSAKFFSLLDEMDDSYVEKMNAFIWCNCLANDLATYTKIDSYPMALLLMAMPNLMINVCHYFCDNYVNPENITRNKEMFELLRCSLREKIEKCSWMSNTTKVGAIKKLEAMECHTGIIDWEKYEAPIPQSEDFCTAFHEILSAKNSMLNIIGADNSNIDNLVAISMMIPLPNGYPSFAANCYYIPNINAMFILPSTSIIVDMNKDINLIMTYISHEMCHAFDVTGANYDELGNFRDWWAIEDRLRFKEIQERLVNIFNQYIAYDQTYCDGEQTLMENMADLGGVEIAHDAVIKQLSEKYSGKELQEKERQFFKNYAISLATYYTDEKMKELVAEDVHSLAEFRINGILNNIDSWYSAFGVKRGDKYYLAPEQRVHFW